MKKKLTVILVLITVCTLAAVLGFITGRARQARIDYQQAILFDSHALSALNDGNTNQTAYFLEGILLGNLHNLDQIKQNPFWPSYPSQQWKEGSGWEKQLKWSRDRIKQKAEMKIEGNAQQKSGR